jgi:hypothetical protein
VIGLAQALPGEYRLATCIQALRTVEDAIEGSGFGGVVRNPWSFLTLSLLAVVLFVVGCGGGGDEASAPPPIEAKSTIPVGNAGGSTVEPTTTAETLKNSPFALNLKQPVPPDFRAAYQRKSFIAVAFFKRNPDTSQGVEYPQGIGADGQVDQSLKSLGSKYPQVEFFTYDIDKPGSATASEDLKRGEYGTLAAQLKVTYTPFVAMLAPRGDGYVIESLFRGYVEKGVLDQALFDLTNVDVGGNSSKTNLTLDQVELTESGGGIEYFTVSNEGDKQANLDGYSLRVQDPETGEISDRSSGVRVNQKIRVAPGKSVSVGRASDVVDADGNEVAGTFTGGGSLALRPGNKVALLDKSGAVVDSISI